MSAANRLTDRAPKRKVRIDFNPDEFNRAVEQHGHRMLWEKASLCPCQNNNETGQPNPGCVTCKGDGWEYWGGQLIRGIVTSLDLDQDTQIAYGVMAAGTAKITVKNEHKPDFRDRYTLLDGLIRFTERRTRHGVTSERLRYYIGAMPLALAPQVDPAPSPPDPESVRGVEQAAFDQAQALASAGHAIDINLSVLRLRRPDATGRQAGPVLTMGVDFDVVNGAIDWRKGDVRGTAPPIDTPFTVTYLYHPRYVVTGFEHTQRDTWVKFKSPAPLLYRLPIETSCKLDHLRPWGE